MDLSVIPKICFHQPECLRNTSTPCPRAEDEYTSSMTGRSCFECSCHHQRGSRYFVSGWFPDQHDTKHVRSETIFKVSTFHLSGPSRDTSCGTTNKYNVAHCENILAYTGLEPCIHSTPMCSTAWCVK